MVADRLAMAARMLHGVCFGVEAAARHIVFFRVKWLQPAMKGGTACAWRLRTVRFDVFCSRIVTVASSCFGCACVRVVIECFGICGCRSQPNGCMIVVMLYGHVRRYMRACHVALQILL